VDARTNYGSSKRVQTSLTTNKPLQRPKTLCLRALCFRKTSFNTTLSYYFSYQGISVAIFRPHSLWFNPRRSRSTSFKAKDLTMLKIVKISLVVAATFGVSATAQADVTEALANICTIVEADDKGELRKKMRSVESDYRLKLKDYYSGVSCGGNSLIRTALLSNAVEAGSLLVKKMPKSDLSAPEADGKTLQAWVAENGLQDNPIAAVLNDRL
jgi:hypothetical protein